ncbi:TPA: hypothetical protein ACW0UP_002959, partial [Enterobacter cloacae]
GSVAAALATRAPGGKSPLRGLFAPSLGLTPLGPAQALSKIAPGNFVFGLFLPAYRGRADVTSL